ncbi:unnamed protein product [Aspergillus oryzae var. brunneus]|uniref:Unnamed protein product n=2 Tax=Aspergillus oryzae TaxID=5062 RepID=A0AAN4YJ53_ASPOZ|nr:unnamed protein product [Aspergillus oryzae]GMG45692.1 unnamed protein product [Aspergillus oryzae var. brunneus]
MLVARPRLSTSLGMYLVTYNQPNPTHPSTSPITSTNTNKSTEASAKNSNPAASASTTLPRDRWTPVSSSRRNPKSKKTMSNSLLELAFFYPQESPEAVEFHKSNGMGNRLTMVEDIAPIVRFLCTDGAWITGQTIFANGGYTTR